jgi:hypothetical protein
VEGRSREVIEDHGQITGCEPDELLQAHITSQGFDTMSTHRLQELDDRTLLTSVLESEYTGFLARLSSVPCYAASSETAGGRPRKLKKLVEAQVESLTG